MAQIVEQHITIKVSKLVKNSADDVEFITSDILNNLETIAQELVGNGAVAEVIRGE